MNISELRSFILRILIVITTLFFFSCEEGTGDVQGSIGLDMVEHIEGKDLSGTIVRIKDLDEATETDVNGEFTFKNIVAGRHTIIISHYKWETKETEIEINAGEKTEFSDSLSYSFGMIKGQIQLPDVYITSVRIYLYLIFGSKAFRKEVLYRTDEFVFSELSDGDYRVEVAYGPDVYFFEKKVKRGDFYEEIMTDPENYTDIDDDGLMDSEDFELNFEPVENGEVETEYTSNEESIVLPANTVDADATVDKGVIVVNGEDKGSSTKVKTGDNIAIKVQTSSKPYRDIETSSIKVKYLKKYVVAGSFSIKNLRIRCNDSTCLDRFTDIEWQKFSPVDKMEWKEAVNYCQNIYLGDRIGWHLPTISELRSLIQNCSVTETDGECDVSDKCLAMYCVNNCGGCKDETDGRYSVFADNGYFWSSSEVADMADYSWIVSFDDGDLYNHPKQYHADVRCVRKYE